MSSKIIGRIGMVGFMILIAVFAPLIAPYDPFAMVMKITTLRSLF